MDKDEIRQKVLDELTALQKEFNIPQIEIDRAVLQFEDLIPLLENKDGLLQQLADDLIDSVKYRANIGIPDTIPDDMIVENIPNQPNLDKVESDELENIFGDEKLNPDYDPELGRKGVMGEDYIPKYAEDFAEFTDGKITSLPDNHIFVFGSNTAGIHGKGAALDAKKYFGAIPEQGYGLQGQSFGIPTKDGKLEVLSNEQIQGYINKFLEFAKNNPDKKFVVTAIGTGLAGKNANEIAAMFTDVPNNIILSKKFSGQDINIYSTESNEFSKLSNPMTPGFTYEGREYKNVEHAYQSLKSGQFDEKTYKAFLNAPDAKRPSRGTMGTDIENSIPLMKNLYKEMLNQNPEQVELLLKTGNKNLTHTQDTTIWKNEFPKMLMELRNEFKGGSLGAAKLNDPYIFPEKIDEPYNEDVHTDFKRNILNQFSPEENKILNAFNNHPVVKDANLNGESVLLGLYKHFGPQFVEKYNNIKDMNIGTKVALGTAGLAVKGSGKFAGLLIKMLRLLDPVGEGLELASKIATKKGVVKAGSFVAKTGTKVASNLYYELANQVVWQASAAVVAGIENGAMALNSVLDKYGLFPQALKDAGVEIVPYQDVMKTASDNYRYWQSKYWQASKTTSLFYLLDTAIPSIVTGKSVPDRLQNRINSYTVPTIFGDRKKLFGLIPNAGKLDELDEEFYDIVMGIDIQKANAERDKWYHVLPGFSLSSGWLQNEMEQPASTHFGTSYYSQVEKPELNELQADSHVSVYKRMEKLQNRFGSDIIPYAQMAIQYWDNTMKNE